jgi:hypothetical protein
MPDITKCDNSECPSCTICWRFMAVPNAYQSYGAFQPDGQMCDNFLSLDGMSERSVAHAKQNISTSLQMQNI